MFKIRIILLVSAIGMILLIFSLPKAVVNNDPDKVTRETDTSTLEPDVHTTKIDPETAKKLTDLKGKVNNTENDKKNISFADSLARLYLSVNKYDSAAKFYEMIALENPGVATWLRAGDTYYDAYGFATDRQKQEMLGEKAREYFFRVLEAEPDNNKAKNKLAMTYLSTSNPMQGIMMLREILENDPENEQALFNLGILSMQSGQYDKAIERFLSVVRQYPANVQAQFFLGVSYLETGKKNKAKEQFKLVKSLDTDPSVQAATESYLQELK